MAKKKYIEWNKCVHIHACRRLSAIIRRETGKNIVRGCGEKCSAYFNKEVYKAELGSIIDDAETALDEIRFGAEENDCTSYAKTLLYNIRTKACQIECWFDDGKDNY